MTTRTYDYILTVNTTSGTFKNSNVIIGGTTSTEGFIANVEVNSNGTSNLKVKVNNVFTEFVNAETVTANVINTSGGNANASATVDVPFVPPTPAVSNTTTAVGTIIDVNNSNYIREKNAFEQNPLVRLYTIYYPGEWYPPNESGNPDGGDNTETPGAGRNWPHNFPLRFAEVRGDLNSDIAYNVTYGAESFTPYPVDSSGISTGSDGEVNEVNLDISNFDNVITTIVEDPDVVGNCTSNAVFAVVNGEVVNGIGPRTVPASASYSVSEHTTVLAAQRSAGHTYSQTVVDSVYGHQNASFIYTQAQTAGAFGDNTWKREKLDSRDLLGAVVEIKSTFANFLDHWPEYSTTRTVFGNVLEMTSTLPYRVGDEIASNNDLNTTAFISQIEENRFIFANNENLSNVTVGDKILILNSEADSEAYVKDMFKVDGLSTLNEKFASFSLVSWLQYFKLVLPKRKYFKNTCQWTYKGEECQYPGPNGGTIPGTALTANTNPIDLNNQVASSNFDDECAKSFEACRIRNNGIHFGGFPGTGRTVPKQ